MKNSRITGVGHYVPPQIVTNKDLEKLMDTSDEWIQERTGIQERRWVMAGEDTTSGMGVKAARIAIERAGISPNEIDLIIFATLSSDYFFPGPGVLVQKELGIKEVGALDIRNQCSGFVYGLSVADQFIKTGMYKTVLLIGSEIQSIGLDKTTRGRNLSVLFGDGAGAAVLQATDDNTKGVLSTHLHSEGKHAEELYLREPGSLHQERYYDGILTDYDGIFPYMNGNFVFKHAVTRFNEVIWEALNANNLKAEDVDMVVPHQANLRITEFVRRKLKLPEEKVFSNIHKYGNTTAATIPIALSELWEEGKLKADDKIVLAAFGSGFTWASALISW